MSEATQSGTTASMAMLNIRGVDLEQLYQAICAKKGTAEAIPLNTLAELRFTRSDEAVNNGYFCVRPHYSAGMRSFPGLWVAPGHQQAVGALAESLRHTASSSRRAAWEAAREREFAQLLAEHQLDLDAYDRDVLYQELVEESWYGLGRVSREKIQRGRFIIPAYC